MSHEVFTEGYKAKSMLALTWDGPDELLHLHKYPGTRQLEWWPHALKELAHLGYPTDDTEF